MTTLKASAQRQQIFNGGGKSPFTFRNVEESLESFSGDDNKDVRRWINEFESLSEMLEWNLFQMLM